MLDFIVSPRGLKITRFFLQSIGWLFAAVFAGVVWTLASQFVRVVILYAGPVGSIKWSILFLIGTWLLLNVVGNYARCILTNPGRINKNPNPPASITRHKNFCRDCGVIPPPRASHCHFCDACILKMDHHCPWVLGCVGFYNQPYFILYLQYCLTGALFLVGVSAQPYFDENFLERLLPAERHEVVSTFVMSSACSILLFLFCGFHVYLALTNQTSIESIEHNFCRTNTPELSIAPSRQYDQGFSKNLEDLFGSQWYQKWWRLLLPLEINRPGNGRDFKVVGEPSVVLQSISLLDA